ncbi:hypothetical protein NIES22_50180 [Calothrix brevissima NIES-22]|nr:hypothetical protein NIES22_50180 [Calothrix brevissima NIES-22]
MTYVELAKIYSIKNTNHRFFDVCRHTSLLAVNKKVDSHTEGNKDDKFTN